VTDIQGLYNVFLIRGNVKEGRNSKLLGGAKVDTNKNETPQNGINTQT